MNAAPATERITTRQLRMLHAVAKQRGFDHAELRTIAGVTSLKHLGKSEAASLIDKLQDDRPEPPARHRSPPGTIRSASGLQRGKIKHLFGDLGWPADSIANWLWRRHQIKNVDADAFSSKAGSAIIVQLQLALKKMEPQMNRDEHR